MNWSYFLRSTKRMLSTLLVILILFNFSLCFAQYEEESPNDNISSSVSENAPQVERVNYFIVWVFAIILVVLMYYIFLTSVYRNKLINGEHPLSAAASTITYWLIIAWLILSIASSNVINWDFYNVTLSNWMGFFIVSALFILFLIVVNSVKPNKE